MGHLSGWIVAVVWSGVAAVFNTVVEVDWFGEPPLGAHVVTPRRWYTHHAIYVGHGKVIQYGGLSRGLRRGPVEEVAMDDFSRGHPIWIQPEQLSGSERQEVVRRARLRLGEDRYELLTNNCEHFCEWCIRGVSRSHQVERVVAHLQRFRAWLSRRIGRSGAVAFLLSSLLAGCITAPHIRPLEKPVDARADLGLGATPAPAQGTWWTAYQDPQLDQLLQAALADNPTLGQTLARLRESQAVVYATRAALWPYISYDANEVRERISSHDTIPSQYDGAEIWKGREGLNFSWDLDFWGRQSALVRQARSEAGATALDAEAARLAIVSAVVRTYIDLERSYELVDVWRREEAAAPADTRDYPTPLHGRVGHERRAATSGGRRATGEGRTHRAGGRDRSRCALTGGPVGKYYQHKAEYYHKP